MFIDKKVGDMVICVNYFTVLSTSGLVNAKKPGLISEGKQPLFNS